MSVIFIQMYSSGGRRKETKYGAARGTYPQMNLLKTPLAETPIRVMTKLEHLTRTNLTTIIKNTLRILYMMKEALNKMNSSHTTGKH